jgi:hypothetical protein
MERPNEDYGISNGDVKEVHIEYRGKLRRTSEWMTHLGEDTFIFLSNSVDPNID